MNIYWLIMCHELGSLCAKDKLCNAKRVSLVFIGCYINFYKRKDEWANKAHFSIF